MSFVAYLSLDLQPHDFRSLDHQGFRCILNINIPYRLGKEPTQMTIIRCSFVRSGTLMGFSFYNYVQQLSTKLHYLSSISTQTSPKIT